ncbi:F-box protein SKIP17-like isoform X2 [Nicotiana sylvestris]|uniref:F-box protein At4g02760-like isoform X2 n=1 Tax=Nicotiana sylvestris TaxID=4096 RepID=A0A1U7XPB3_NICSY|nr:PREDICTED: F-box protein At4g02760-like isoform X2 [Nicotiana sylvestris]
MDTLLLRRQSLAMETPKPSPKRPCCSATSGLNPKSTTSSNGFSSYIDHDVLLESFLGLSDSSFDLSFNRLLSSKASDSEQNDMINRALRLGSALLEAGKRSARARDSMHNAVVWALPSDLTIKVFSLLDTQSLCYAAVTSSFFKNCAADPACYANVDLITVVPRVNNVVVATMVHRAGNGLQSLKLGFVPGPLASSSGSSQPMVNFIRKSTDAAGFSWNDKRSRQGKEYSILTRSCLAPLNANNGTPGACLRRLHLYNIERLDNTALNAALSACPSLLDLEIVGLHVELRQTLESISKFCPLIERLFFESSKTGRDDSLKLPTCSDLVSNCPHLSSLALRGFKLHDYKARILAKGFRKLRYIDFSTSYSITGAFLKNLGGSVGGGLLQVLILRDCMHLKEDISNREGLVSEGDWYHRCYSPSFIPIVRLSEERPDLCVLAEFPLEGSFNDVEQHNNGDVNSEINSSSHLSSLASDSSSFMSASESSDSSDQGSGSEDSSFMYEESSDEVDQGSI